jgi:hypothetical protein
MFSFKPYIAAIATLTSLCTAFADTSATDKLSYFKNSYEESDANFTEIYNKFRPFNEGSEVYQFLYTQGNIKSYFFPGKNVDKLLILISGTHGVEGFTGSAVQRYLVDQGLPVDRTSVLLIHGFNLWGFKNFRRVNENNIDLNRNFVIDRNHFRPDDTAYSQLNNFLNPQTPANGGLFSHSTFLVRAVMNIMQYSIESLRASILKGQYSFEKGLFYGGINPQAQDLLIDQLVQRYIKTQKKVFLIDLHTGYGVRSKLHLLAGRSTDPNSQNLKRIFSEEEIDFSDKKKFYAVEGEMLTFFADRIAKKIPQAEVVGITFEYGTLDSQKTLGSIESLRRMVLENQNFHYPSNETDSSKIKNLYLEMFYPSDSAWRLSVIDQTDEKIKKIYNYLK